MIKDPSFPGFGIGLRPEHYQTIVDTRPAIDWFEIVSEDFMVDGGSSHYYLDEIRAHYPIAMHGVSLSIGSCDPLNWDYLRRLKTLIDRVQPMWVSDHFCWTGVDGVNLHDLMPLPFTQECIDHVVERVKHVQDFLGQQILLENVSCYVSYKDSEMTEWECMSAIAEKADCLLLFDVNNVYVNAFNHRFDPMDFIKGVPAKRVRQFHIAGHKHCQTHIIDTHDSPIIQDVWELYEAALKQFGPVATLIERDDNIPPIEELMEELKQAKAIYNRLQKQTL